MNYFPADVSYADDARATVRNPVRCRTSDAGRPDPHPNDDANRIRQRSWWRYRMKNIFLPAVLSLLPAYAFAQSVPDGQSYRTAGNPNNTVRSADAADSVSTWIGKKMDVQNGTAVSPTLKGGVEISAPSDRPGAAGTAIPNTFWVDRYYSPKTGSVLKSVYLAWPMGFQILKRRSARRTLWRTGCGLQTIPEHSARLSQSCGSPGRSASLRHRRSGTNRAS